MLSITHQPIRPRSWPSLRFFLSLFSSARPNEFFQIQAYLIHWFRLLALLFSLFLSPRAPFEELRKGIRRFQSAKFSPRAFRLLAAFGVVCYTISPAGAVLLQRLCTPLRNTPVIVRGINRENRHFANKDLSVALLEFLPKMRAYGCFPPLVVTKNEHASLSILKFESYQAARSSL